MDFKDDFHDPLDDFKKGIDHYKSFAGEDTVYLHEAVDVSFRNIVRWQFSGEPTFKRIKSHFEKVEILKNIFQEKFESAIAKWICELQKHIGAEETHPIEEIKKLFFKKQRITETQFQTMIGMEFEKFVKKSEFTKYFEIVNERNIVLKKIEFKKDYCSDNFITDSSSDELFTF